MLRNAPPPGMNWRGNIVDMKDLGKTRLGQYSCGVVGRNSYGVAGRSPSDASELYTEFQHHVQRWQRDQSHSKLASVEEILPAAGTESASELLDLGMMILESGDFETRWEVAKLLPELGAIAIAPLLQILADPQAEEELRWFAGQILKQFQEPTVIATLAHVLRTPESQDLQRLAAEILGSFGKSALPIVEELVASEKTRKLGVYALSHIHHPDVVSILLNLIPDTDPQVYTLGLEILSDFDDPRTIPPLIGGLNHLTAQVRRAAVVGLGVRAETQGTPRAGADRIVKELHDRLWDFNLEVCQQAAIALGRWQTLGAAISLQTILHSQNTPEALKLTAIQALGWIATHPAETVSEPKSLAFQSLLEALGSPEESLRLELIRVLGQLSHTELQRQATERLIQVLAGENRVAVQAGIALSLGYLQQPEGISALIGLLAEPEIKVRLHAIASLKTFGTLAYAQLQAMREDKGISLSLQEGVAIALQEW